MVIGRGIHIKRNYSLEKLKTNKKSIRRKFQIINKRR